MLNFQSKYLLHAMCIAALVTVRWTPPADAHTSWRKFDRAGKAAMIVGDKQYAYFKFKEAWLAVGDSTFTKHAYQKIYKDMTDTTADVSRETLTALNESIIDKPNYLPWTKWTVTKSVDGTLNLSVPLNFGQSSRNCLGQSEAQRKAERQWQELHNLLPIKVTRESKKYQELSALCGDITIDSPKQIDFNLSPFVPDQFNGFGPLARMTPTGFSYKYNRLWNARIGGPG